MTVRPAAAGVALVLLAGVLSGCAQQPPRCTLNFVTVSPGAIVISGHKARAVSFDMSVAHVTRTDIRGPELDVYDIGLRRDLGGPPVGANPSIYLPEGHKFRLTLKMSLMNGHVLDCGVKTVNVPDSPGDPTAPSPSAAPSAASA